VPGLGKLTWKGGRTDISNEELTDIFKDELEKAKYKVIGTSDSLFEDPADWKADLLVGGIIKEIQMNVCFPKGGFFNYSTVKGECYIKVNWQVYSRMDRKVIFETTTEGFHNQDSQCDGGTNVLVHDAFAVAINNLIADKGFHQTVSIASKPAMARGYPKLMLKAAKKSTRPLPETMSDVRAAVVTILSGKGHGSGFFVSPDGYLITNDHVVGNAKFVKVKLPTGREVLGEVVRADTRRDVALIRVEEKEMPSLSVLKTEPNVGEDVFAIGSPLDDKYQTTVSKGVVSGYRVEQDVKYLQSDVNVLPGSSGGCLVDKAGNVVGITVKGIMIKGAPAGLNFFVPVNEALQTLNVDLQL
jgi:S1-C subfamily serine protease